jgi:hypothetical protein
MGYYAVYKTQADEPLEAIHLKNPRMHPTMISGVINVLTGQGLPFIGLMAETREAAIVEARPGLQGGQYPPAHSAPEGSQPKYFVYKTEYGGPLRTIRFEPGVPCTENTVKNVLNVVTKFQPINYFAATATTHEAAIAEAQAKGFKFETGGQSGMIRNEEPPPQPA